MKEIRTLLLLGGTWHDFDGFSEFVQTILKPLGCRIECTRELDRLNSLEEEGVDLVVKYTCFSETLENGALAPVRFTDAHAGPLVRWVAGGGAFLPVHCATVSCQSSPLLRGLIGGTFLGHPPAFDVAVRPMATSHPVTAGVGMFCGRDELYIHDMEPGVAAHMVAVDRGVAHPMVWTRSEGRGRIGYVAPGHDGQVWNLPPYRLLLAQTASWVLGSKS